MPSTHFRSQEHHGITWIDISDPTREQVAKAMEGRALHPLHLDASLLDGHLPQVEKEADYVFLLLHLPHYNRAEGKVETKQVAVFLAKDYLITIHRGSLSNLERLFDACADSPEQCEQYFQKSSGYLLNTILTHLLTEAADIIQTILEELDQIEDVVFDDHVAATYEIGQLRQRITKLKRLMDFLKNLLFELAPHIDEYTSEKLAHYYRSTARKSQRLSILLEEAKETIEIFKDADYTASNQKTNTTLAVLTIIFTLTIPATVIGSFYGMNIPLPGGLSGSGWTFWGTYTTLIVVLGLSLIPAIVMLWYFKKQKWF